MRSNSDVGLLSPGVSASAFWLPAVLKLQETPLLDLLKKHLKSCSCILSPSAMSSFLLIGKLHSAQMLGARNNCYPETPHKKGVPFSPEPRRRRAWCSLNSHLTAAPAYCHVHEEGWLSVWRYSSGKPVSGKVTVIDCHWLPVLDSPRSEHAPIEVLVLVWEGWSKPPLHLSLMWAADNPVHPKAGNHLSTPSPSGYLRGDTPTHHIALWHSP